VSDGVPARSFGVAGVVGTGESVQTLAPFATPWTVST